MCESCHISLDLARQDIVVLSQLFHSLSQYKHEILSKTGALNRCYIGSSDDIAIINGIVF